MQMIEFIKDEFSKPSILVYKYKGCLLESLKSNDFNKIYDIDLIQNINECSELSFSIIVTEDRKLDYSSNELLIYFANTWFIIKEINTDLNNHTMRFNCTEMSCVLKGVYCEELKIIAETASSIFSKIISSTGYSNIGFQWLGTDVDDSILRHLIADKETSVYENLVNMAKNFNGSIEFIYDNNGVGYIYLRTQSIASHKFIKKDIDIKTLSITSSSTEIYTRLYPTGYSDDYGIVLDVQSVNDGKAIIEDFSFYKAIGIPDDIITNNPQYQQLKTLSDDTYTTSEDLLKYAKEELAKYCKPQFTAETTIEDLSIYIDSVIEQPKINMALKIIDKSINFVFDCLITGIERNYNNALETKLIISNIIPYSTTFQSLQATSDVVSKVVSTSNGSPTVNVNYIAGTLNAQNTSLIGTVDTNTSTDKQSTIAILFEDKRIGQPTYGAMGFGTKGLCIANELNVDGSWKWNTFGTSNGFNASLVKTGILSGNNGDFSLDLVNNITHVKTQIQGTKDNQIASTEFVQNEIEAKKTIVGTITSPITVGTGSIDLTITGLGTNPIVFINGDYSINTAQILGVKNVNTDIVVVYYSNAIAGDCKFNYSY